MSVCEIDSRIEELEEELSRLRLHKRAQMGGVASGRARKNQVRNEKVRARFTDLGGDAAAIRALAGECGISEKQIRRIVKPPPLAASESVGAAGGHDSKPAGEGSIRRGIDHGKLWEDIDHRLNWTEGLAGLINHEAAEVRVPGRRRFDLEDFLRSIESTVDELLTEISELRGALARAIQQ